MAKKILSQPGVCGGRPTFEGTRIEPRHILPLLGAQSDATILEDYPSLDGEDLKTLRLWPQDNLLKISKTHDNSAYLPAENLLAEHAQSANHPFDVQDLSLKATQRDKAVGWLYGHGLYKRLHITHLAVDPNHRKEGIGQALLSAAEEWAKSEGLKFICLDTWSHQAEAFYLAQGYTEIGRGRDIKGTPTKIFFEKSL